MIYLVKDDDVWRAGVVAETVEQHVFRCGLPLDADGIVDAVEDGVEGFEAAVVFPAVHVLVVHVDDFLAESFDGELRDTDLPGSGRPVQERRISPLSVRERAEYAG